MRGWWMEWEGTSRQRTISMDGALDSRHAFSFPLQARTEQDARDFTHVL